jgi:hypothetical protein
MQMKKAFVITFTAAYFFLMYTEIYGQNLVRNSGFDEYYNYYDTNNNLVYHPSYWSYVDSLLNHPIYFCTDRYLNKPLKWNIHPDSLVINKGGSANYISVVLLPYVQRAYTQLKEPLKKGMKYSISADVRLSERSNYTSDILIGFNTHATNFDSSLYTIQLKIPDSLCNPHIYYNWITLETEFNAKGGERFLVIGGGNITDYKRIVFTDNKKFLLTPFQGPPKIKYYIDNITVEARYPEFTVFID